MSSSEPLPAEALLEGASRALRALAPDSVEFATPRPGAESIWARRSRLRVHPSSGPEAEHSFIGQ
eukprot:11330340-Heterocapsa_arctica.AAC.1